MCMLVMFCYMCDCGLKPIDFAHSPKDYYINTFAPIPMQQPWRLWVYKSYASTDTVNEINTKPNSE